MASVIDVGTQVFNSGESDEAAPSATGIELDESLVYEYCGTVELTQCGREDDGKTSGYNDTELTEIVEKVLEVSSKEAVSREIQVGHSEDDSTAEEDSIADEAATKDSASRVNG